MHWENGAVGTWKEVSSGKQIRNENSIWWVRKTVILIEGCETEKGILKVNSKPILGNSRKDLKRREQAWKSKLIYWVEKANSGSGRQKTSDIWQETWNWKVLYKVGFGITVGANSKPLKKQCWQFFPRARGQSAVAVVCLRDCIWKLKVLNKQQI